MLKEDKNKTADKDTNSSAAEAKKKGTTEKDTPAKKQTEKETKKGEKETPSSDKKKTLKIKIKGAGDVTVAERAEEEEEETETKKNPKRKHDTSELISLCCSRRSLSSFISALLLCFLLLSLFYNLRLNSHHNTIELSVSWNRACLP